MRQWRGHFGADPTTRDCLIQVSAPANEVSRTHQRKTHHTVPYHKRNGRLLSFRKNKVLLGKLT
jgi:hypothetical protein